MDLNWQLAMLSVRVTQLEQGKLGRKMILIRRESARKMKQRYSSFKDSGRLKEESLVMIAGFCDMWMPIGGRCCQNNTTCSLECTKKASTAGCGMLENLLLWVSLLRTGKVNIPPARPQPVPTGKPKVLPTPPCSTARPMPHLNRPTNLIERMLDHQLEICHGTVGNELTTAVQLIAFLKKQISDSKRPKVHEWVINSPCYHNKELASPEQTATAEVVPKSVAGSSFPAASSTYVVPTGRVIVPTGRYIVPAGKVIIIVSPGDQDRYMRDYAAYEQFVALCEKEAGGSGSGPNRRRTYVPREREEAEQRLIDDYFGNDEFLPKYPEENFRRKYRISSTLFNKIVNDILSYDVQPLPEYFKFFRQRYDAVGRLSIGPILKCTSAIRQLAYDTAPDAFDEFPGANNDLNVLYDSSLFDDELADRAPECPFVVNRHTYRKCYYLVDDIYPAWSTFVKTYTVARDEKTLNFKRVQVSSRKDIE
ncbi:Toll/interleukin-1 receptor domain-containing protein [Tanacetum coccineum]|uniref:Toll/interleukin-1 receptor domain-containing protein n=1 Tax=Tanacetum coccineum TaxID=301880 RepID=A0ABQ4Z5N9_9ASTR